jgi:uncharacterized protein (TIGR00369 family)
MATSKKARLRHIARRIMAAAWPDHLGVRVRIPKAGSASATAPARQSTRQVHGLVHGGWIASVADTCQTAAAYSALPAGSELLTTDFSLRFLRALKWGPAKIEARVVKAGRRVVVVEADVFDRKGDLVARGSFSNLVL